MLLEVMDDQVLGLLLLRPAGLEHESIAGHIHIIDLSKLGLEGMQCDARPLAQPDPGSGELPEKGGFADIGPTDEDDFAGHIIRGEGNLKKDVHTGRGYSKG